MTELTVTFNADKLRISGPKVDGSYSVTFETGEYEQQKIAELLTIPQQTPMTVIVSEYKSVAQ